MSCERHAIDVYISLPSESRKENAKKMEESIVTDVFSCIVTLRSRVG